MHLNRDIVGMAATPDGGGYWLVGADGGVFTGGDAGFHGSTGGMHLNQAIVGMAATRDGGGYWLVGADGGVFTFGDARFAGSLGDRGTPHPIVGLAPSGGGQGYWLAEADGTVFGEQLAVAANAPVAPDDLPEVPLAVVLPVLVVALLALGEVARRRRAARIRAS
jgi:hypothetical protein